jgi:hypothetical protein
MKSAKKVRIEDTSTTPPTAQASPSNLALAALFNGLQALHQHLRDNEVFTGLAEKTLQLFFMHESKVKSAKKFGDETYLPQSCRVKVNLRGTQRIFKTDEFKELQEEAEADIKAFQHKMRDHMKKANFLEITALKSELHERIVKFADLIVKQKLLLSTDACRVHTQSNGLTYKLFENPKELDDGASDDRNSSDSETQPEEHFEDIGLHLFMKPNKDLKTLLSIPVTSDIQLNDTEKEIVSYTKKCLKKTISHAFHTYTSTLKDRNVAREAKEILLEAITTEAADNMASALDEETDIPNNITDLKDMFNQLLTDFHAKETQHSVKGDRGAKKGNSRASLKNKKKKEPANSNNNRNGLTLKGKRKKRKKQNSADVAAPGSNKGGKTKKNKNTSNK